MARPPEKTAGGRSQSERTLPTPEQILAFVGESGGKAGKREIARAFGLQGPEKNELKQLLKDMQDDGRLTGPRSALKPAVQWPDMTVAAIEAVDAAGALWARPLEWEEERLGAEPRIRIDLPRKLREGGRAREGALAAPGVGDRVLLRLGAPSEPDEPASGRVVKVLSKRQDLLLGVFRPMPDGSGRIASIDKKASGRELHVPRADTMDAQDGDLVAVEAGRESRLGLRQGRVRERLGSLRSERAVSLIALHAHNIPHVFRPATLAEAEAAKPAPRRGREDWRALPLLTIDPADAKDHDDAVHAAPDDDPGNRGGFVLTVAIADVAAYVRPGSSLDAEALERGNSVYFPDRVVPMLPERISNDLCSLRPGVDRPAMAARIIIDARGRKLGHTFHRITMRSAAKLSYQQAQAAMDGAPDDATAGLLETALRPLWSAYASLRAARDSREPLDLDLPERKLVLNAEGFVTGVVTPERLDAHRLIEEFMVLANVCAAETLEAAKAPVMYRVHDEPKLEKMEGLRVFLKTLGIELPKAGAVRPTLFNRILGRTAEGENALLVNEVILRSQAQAEYAPENYGHFGLNLRRYAHFTSPIRRYADLIVHRSLITALKLGSDGLPPMTLPELRETGQRISVAERRAMTAERETVDRLIAIFLADKVGATFEGRISGVVGAGVFVRLRDTGADGFVPAATLGADFYKWDEAQRALIGMRTGEAFRLGDSVTVKLIEAQPVAGALRFEILSQGRTLSLSKGARGGRRQFGAAVKAGRGQSRAGARGKR